MALRLIRAGTRLVMLCNLVDDEGDVVREIPLVAPIGKPTAENTEAARQTVLQQYSDIEAALTRQGGAPPEEAR